MGGGRGQVQAKQVHICDPLTFLVNYSVNLMDVESAKYFLLYLLSFRRVINSIKIFKDVIKGLRVKKEDFFD